MTAVAPSAVRHAPGWRSASILPAGSILLGAAMLSALWLGPLVPMSRTAFSPHMLLHLGVVVVAAPLIGYGVAHYLKPPTSLRAAFSWCFLAATFDLVAVWGWHIPLLHNAQGYSLGLFVLEQASFLVAGLGLWTAAFACRNAGTAAAPLLALFFSFTHMTMFGLMLTLAPRLIYDPDICRGAFGLDRLADQHLGGILMAIGGGLPYLLGTAWAAWRLIARSSDGAGVHIDAPTLRSSR